MIRKIAIEHNLTPIMEYLMEKGFQVETIDVGTEFTKNIDKYDALVVTGLNNNLLGVQDTVSKIPVIEAKGLTKEDVLKQLNNKFNQ